MCTGANHGSVPSLLLAPVEIALQVVDQSLDVTEGNTTCPIIGQGCLVGESGMLQLVVQLGNFGIRNADVEELDVGVHVVPVCAVLFIVG